MKKPAVFVVAAVFALSAGLAAQDRPTEKPTAGAPPRPSATAFDFSAIDRLWKIVDVLEKDGEPSLEDWEGLVRTPGYSALIAHENGYGLDFLKKYLRLVFKPSMAADLDKAARTNSLRHFLDLKAKRDALREFQAKIQNPAVSGEALALVKAWLPEKSMDGRPAPTAAFIVFDRDARGGYGPLIFDLLYAFDQGDSFKRLYAHEAFHYYRKEMAAADPGSIRRADEHVLGALGCIQDEGMADLIDKADLIAGGDRSWSESEYGRSYLKNMADTPRILGALDVLLGRLDGSPSDAYEIASEMDSTIPMSGHPTGGFMTRAILAAGGKAELIRTFNNPFAFFYLYNAAALKNPALPCLSNSAVTALQNLERRIIPSPEKKLASAALARGVDVSALDLLWPIISLLAKDEEPNASLWDRFFGHPGYRVYFGWEGDSRTSLKNAMSLAFKPGREAERKQALEKGAAGSLEYFLRYQKESEAIVRSCREFRNGGLFEKTLKQVLTILPQNAGELLADAQIALIPLGYSDVRAGYHPMLIDPLEIGASAGALARFIRFYLFTRFRDKIRPYDAMKLTRRQATFIDAIELIQDGGRADFLTVNAGEAQDPELQERYDARLKDVPTLLGKMDRILAKAASDPAAWREFETLQRDFTLVLGSPIGYFMTAAIADALGPAALVETAETPAGFLHMYRQATLKKGGLPTLSEQAVEFARHLEDEAKTTAAKSGRP